jgi:dihydrofolate reductase
MELSAYLAISVDGYIARANGSMDWLRGGGRRPADEERRYHAFVESVDAIVLGRATYEGVRHAPVWPYGTKPVVVLSHHPVTVPAALSRWVEPMSGEPADLVRRFHSRGWQHLYVDGGRTIQTFLAAGLLHRLILNRVPVLIGAGISLFGAVPQDVWLDHLRSETYPGGLVQSEYRVRPIAT